MIKPNWDIFRVKFSENPQVNFEWLCYLLFCKEFNKPFGVSGYTNHRHIEHNPIEANGKVIGWQSKFYDIPIAQHKDEILKLIEGAKNDYPNISHIIFYCNKNWGQGKKQNEAKAKIEIDKRAKELGIEIDWNHLENFFNSSFVIDENKLIGKHYFTLDRSITDIITDFEIHSKSILYEIRGNIEFNGKVIEVNRNELVETIKNSLSNVIVLSGEGGVGKTAVIKKLFQISEQIPFYIFKASEFELRSINDFFKPYSLQNFITAHQDDTSKIIVIDSAEKLLDLKNPEPFKEFLSLLTQNNWKIIFTIRNSFVENLNYDFFEIYNIVPVYQHLQDLTLSELNSFSATYNFTLPTDHNLLELIRNPFYLGEYLRFYKEKEQLDYEGFKNKLWNQKIKKSKALREQCFLQFAIQRANEGLFFINPELDINTLEDLKNDGILGYEIAGYFITHDIYEEWALEKIIQVEFDKENNPEVFLKNIGQALPVRRSFRNWISRKLLLNDKKVQSFIEQVIKSKEIENYWKNEVLVSTLLSDYSDIFFTNFKALLLENHLELLRNLTFLLRVAGKEIDIEFFSNIGVKDVDVFTLEFILTKPKGQGWESLIKFVYDNLEEIGIKNIFFMIPVINDWNSNFKTGNTTKYSSLLALKYYEWIFQNDVYLTDNEKSFEKVFQTIFYGAVEIKDELKSILESVISNNWKKRKDPYYSLSNSLLSKLEGIPVSKILPEHVIRLADLFWTINSSENDDYRGYRDEIDTYFNIEEDHHRYFPPSPFKTPIYWLLQFELIKTFDFILNFTNKAVEAFAKSRGIREYQEIEEIEVLVGKEKYKKQYIGPRLWGMYRGTQVGPNVLVSMHMALEKYLLKVGKNLDNENLEFILFYLLERTNSASITSIVVSIVVAFYEKTFNVAKILFETKEFFLYETSRYIADQTHKSQLISLSKYMPNPKTENYDKERIKACDDPHRKSTLENIFLQYQFFRNESVSDNEADERQKILWGILDKYYDKLPPEHEQSEYDRTWRFYLARMDRRKMNPTTEETEKGFIINFNPELDTTLKKISEESESELNEKTKYTSIKVWAGFKFRNEEQSKQYPQYENNPHKVFTELKELVDTLTNKTIDTNSINGEFIFLNYSTPREVCAVLLRDYYNELSSEELDYCVNLILEVASSISNVSYQYKILDRIDSVFAVLPIIFEKYPEHRKDISTILLFSLFNEQTIDMAHNTFNLFAKLAIQKLWKTNFDYAQSILIGYLFLRPKYDEVINNVRNQNYKKKIYDLELSEVWKILLIENKEFLDKLFSKQNSLNLSDNISDVKLKILLNVFLIIPFEIENKEQMNLVKKIISIFAEKLLSPDREDKLYFMKFDFLQKLSYLTLSSPQEEIQNLIQPFSDGFKNSENTPDFFNNFIYAEDNMHTYEKFWTVWLIFQEKIIKLCEKGGGYGYIDEIIKSYLFARVEWKETATKWESITIKEKDFFNEMVEKIGHCSATLYSFAKLLNGIGSMFIDEGIKWLASIISNNKKSEIDDLDPNTIYYLEKYMRKYIHKNRINVKRSKKLKEHVLVITEFLISKNSVVGYILRESII